MPSRGLKCAFAGAASTVCGMSGCLQHHELMILREAGSGYGNFRTFAPMIAYMLNCRGRLVSLSKPMVMGILNLTPDSFYAESRMRSEAEIRERIRQMKAEGADMVDVGAYSSRPGADDVSFQEEALRLRRGMKIVREEWPDVPVSIDTFRADVAKLAVEELGADIINDISGGEIDKQMFPTVARLGVPYVLMHMKGTPANMQQAPEYEDVGREVMLYLAERLDCLHSMGAKDIIVDPGFGFGKTLAHNYELFARMEDFHALGRPILVGVSRKSMVYRLLDGTPQTALNGTTVLHTVALLKGAHILRVHDVREAVEVREVVMKILSSYD